MASTKPRSGTSKPSGSSSPNRREVQPKTTGVTLPIGAESERRSKPALGAHSKTAASTRAAAAPRARATAPRASTLRSGAKRSPGRAKPSRAAALLEPGSSNGNGVTDTLKDVASKAEGPAVAVGAAAAGVAGGLVIKSRTRRKTILGVPVPHLP